MARQQHSSGRLDIFRTITRQSLASHDNTHPGSLQVRVRAPRLGTFSTTGSGQPNDLSTAMHPSWWKRAQNTSQVRVRPARFGTLSKGLQRSNGALERLQFPFFGTKVCKPERKAHPKTSQVRVKPARLGILSTRLAISTRGWRRALPPLPASSAERSTPSSSAACNMTQTFDNQPQK